MSTSEFSDEFEVMLLSFSTLTEFGNQDLMAFTEYEKSVYLTAAEEEYVKSLYAGKNVYSDSFESTEDIAEQLTPLLERVVYSVTKPKADGTGIILDNKVKPKKLKAGGFTHYLFRLPSDMMYIFYEECMLSPDLDCCAAGNTILVKPIKHDEYYKTVQNPFRGPNARRALRLNYNDNVVEIVAAKELGLYRIGYLRKPKPIILEQLIDNSIDGYRDEMTCELDSLCHRQILEIAVQAALASRRTAISK